MTDYQLIQRIAERAVKLYERINMRAPKPEFIAAELTFVHQEIVPLRLQEFLDSDDGNFAHDIGGIHRHLDIIGTKFNDCFLPRFARL